MVEIASAVTTLEINDILGLNDVVWRGVINYLVAVEKLSIWMCNEIRYVWESQAVASKVLMKLRYLDLSDCDNLVSLGEKENDNCRINLLSSLRFVFVSDCKNMEYFNCPDSVETLRIECCNSVTDISLPTGGLKLKSLVIEGCEKLLETEWGGQKMNSNISRMLEYLTIRSWPNLKSILELSYLVHLTELTITDCASLESFPDNELPSLTSLNELEITCCPNLDASFGVWPPKLHSLTIGKLKKPISEWGLQIFPTSLGYLCLCHEDGVSSFSQLSHLLHSSILSLEIAEFEKLESVSMGLEHLTSLRHLGYYRCPNLMNLPEVLLPSLLSLRIGDCPKLTERCSKRGGGYWPLISHIPCIDICSSEDDSS